MQPLETAMLIILAATLCIPLVPPSRRPAWAELMLVIGPVCVAVLFQLHAGLEGPRREMMGAYALGFLLLLIAGLRFLAERARASAAPPRPRAPVTTPVRLATIAAALAGLAVVALTVQRLGAAAP